MSRDVRDHNLANQNNGASMPLLVL